MDLWPADQERRPRMVALNAMAHLGMKWTGAGHEADGRKVLIAENLDSHRRWSIDPATGIGEPMREELAARSGETQVAAPAAQPSRPRVSNAAIPTRERAPRRVASAEPEACEHCGAKSVYQIRFS